ncbi:MAG: hypothetical protein WCR63_04530 [Bacilli bacterium]
MSSNTLEDITLEEENLTIEQATKMEAELLESVYYTFKKNGRPIVDPNQTTF